jgi:hypothetical protein
MLMSKNQTDTPLGLGPCETCGATGEELGEDIRFVKYLPADDPAEDHATLSPARPAHGIVCWECGTPRGFITRDEKRRLQENEHS